MILSGTLLQMKVDADGADGRRYRKKREKPEALDQKDRKTRYAACKIQIEACK